MLHDLSPIIDPSLPVWPGDTPFSSRFTWNIKAGDAVNVGAFETTTHLGAHIDAPLHTEAEGTDIAQLALETFVGPCRLIRIPAGERVEAAHLHLIEREPTQRVLLRTDSVKSREHFSRTFTTISLEAAHLMVECGVILVGIDTPSVDPPDSKSLEAHHRLAGAGVAILEGLVLEGVKEGHYELIALPLRLAGLDASPVRAVLRSPGPPQAR